MFFIDLFEDFKGSAFRFVLNDVYLEKKVFPENAFRNFITIDFQLFIEWYLKTPITSDAVGNFYFYCRFPSKEEIVSLKKITILLLTLVAVSKKI